MEPGPVFASDKKNRESAVRWGVAFSEDEKYKVGLLSL